MNKLNLPSNYNNIDENEMEYIDGGVYITNRQLKNICAAVGTSAASVAGVIASVDAMATFMAATVPGLGALTGGVIAIYATKFAFATVQAIAQGKGMEISLTFPLALNFSPA